MKIFHTFFLVLFLSTSSYSQVYSSDSNSDYQQMHNKCINPNRYGRANPNTETVSENERRALIDFYCDTFESAYKKNMNGWIHYDDWLSDNNVNNWYGVHAEEFLEFYYERGECVDELNHSLHPYSGRLVSAAVTKLELANNNIITDFTLKDFTLNPLNYLRKLNLNGNDLSSYKITNQTNFMQMPTAVYYKHCTVRLTEYWFFGRQYRRHEGHSYISRNALSDSNEKGSFILSNTNIQGEVGDSFFGNNIADVGVLILHNNLNLKLNQKFLSSLENANNFTVLNLRNSNFNGDFSFYDFIVNNPFLNFIDIQNNNFEYEYSYTPTVFKYLKTHNSIESIDISDNMFKGILYYDQMSKIKKFDASSNQFSSIDFNSSNTQLSELNDLNSNIEFDISDNNFPELSPIVNQLYGENIDLSDNNFTFKSFNNLNPSLIKEHNKSQRPIKKSLVLKQFKIPSESSFSLTALFDHQTITYLDESDLSYQWYQYQGSDKVLIPGATDNVLNLLPVDTVFNEDDLQNNTKKYTCKIDSQHFGFSLYTEDMEVEIVYNLNDLDMVHEEPEKGADNTPDSFYFEPNTTYVMSAWVKKEDVSDNNENVYAFIEYQNSSQEYTTQTGQEYYPKGEKINGWQRIYTELDVPEGTTDVELSLINTSGNNAYLDDIRFWPKDGSMKSFVYDPISHRLMAELDENNYATYYEYDQEGTLIRVKKETVRGIFTIKETRNRSYLNTNTQTINPAQ